MTDSSPMSQPEPSPDRAHELLADADRLAARTRSGNVAPARYLAVLASVTAVWFLVLAFVGGTDRGVAASAIGFGVVVAAASVGFLSPMRVSRYGFGRRFGAAMTLWGAVFAVTLTAGLLWFREVPPYWVVAALAAAAPAWIGARVVGRL